MVITVNIQPKIFILPQSYRILSDNSVISNIYHTEIVYHFEKFF